MASGPVNKSPLHNYPLTFLKWGSKTHHQKQPFHPSPSQPEPEPEPDPIGALRPQHEPDNENKQWDLRPRRVVASSSSKKSMKGVERREKRKFWIALSREEIEEDIYSLTGSKPSRKPRRHPKNTQKQLDNVFPGFYLVGLTPESYRGLDVPPKR